MINRLFCILMFSAHGTFLGHIRLEPHKPQQIPIDSTVSFGASTRAYTLREKPQTLPSAVKGDEKMGGEDEELKGLLGLPEEETELDVSTMTHCTWMAFPAKRIAFPSHLLRFRFLISWP